jgi:hypothetical protein
MGHDFATIRLEHPVPGLDPVKAIDAQKLCSTLYMVDGDAELLGLESLKTFGVWPGQRPTWWSASEGLKTVRGLIADYESRIASGADSRSGLRNAALPGRVSVLRQLEAVLDRADTHDSRFFLAVK